MPNVYIIKTTLTSGWVSLDQRGLRENHITPTAPDRRFGGGGERESALALGSINRTRENGLTLCWEGSGWASGTMFPPKSSAAGVHCQGAVLLPKAEQDNDSNRKALNEEMEQTREPSSDR